MPNAIRVPRSGIVVAATWAVAGGTHIGAAIESVAAAPALHYVLAATALVGALLLCLAARPALLVASAVAGTVGVAAFVIPLLLPVLGAGGASIALTPWTLAAFVLDALTVRLAVFTLRRQGYNQATQPASRA